MARGPRPRGSPPPRRAGSPGSSHHRSRSPSRSRHPPHGRGGRSPRRARPAPAWPSAGRVGEALDGGRAPKLSQERKIASVETRAVPCAAIVAASSASISIPCSSESTPAGHPFAGAREIRRVGGDLHPAAWAAATTGASSSAVHGATPRLRAVQVELEQVGAIVELADGVAEQLGGIVGRHDPLAGDRPRLVQPRAGRTDVSGSRPAPPAISDAEAQRPRPPVHGIGDRAARRRLVPIGPRPGSSAGALCSATSSSRSRGPRCARSSGRPRAASRWLWQSTIPGHDRRAAGVDTSTWRRRGLRALVVARADPGDGPVDDEEADPDWAGPTGRRPGRRRDRGWRSRGHRTPLMGRARVSRPRRGARMRVEVA